MGERTQRENRTHRRGDKDGGHDARRAERRAELLTAAIGAVRTEGPEVSMEAMARAGGVTKPILYRHFGDRDGLVAAVGLEFASRFDAEVLRRLDPDAEDPAALLATTVDAYLRVIEDDPAVYRFVVRHAATDAAPGDDLIGAFIDEIANRVALVIGEQLRRRGQDSGMAEPWAHAIVGAVHQAADWWLDRRTLTRGRLVEYLMALLWDGMSSFAIEGDQK